MSMYFSRFVLLGVLVFGSQALVTLAEAQAVDDIVVPPVPTNSQVPAGHSVFLAGHAIGTQNFICLAFKKEMVWRFTGPQATLFTVLRNNTRQQLTTHFLSANPGENGLPRPTWQHSDD